MGDTIYPFTAIDLCNMGAQPAEYVRSLAKLATLVADENAAPARGPVLASASAPEAVTPLPTESESDPRIAALVVGRLGMDLESAAAVFDAHRLLYDVCHGDVRCHLSWLLASDSILQQQLSGSWTARPS